MLEEHTSANRLTIVSINILLVCTLPKFLLVCTLQFNWGGGGGERYNYGIVCFVCLSVCVYRVLQLLNDT